VAEIYWNPLFAEARRPSDNAPGVSDFLFSLDVGGLANFRLSSGRRLPLWKAFHNAEGF
jgi:hypothetical protein